MPQTIRWYIQGALFHACSVAPNDNVARTVMWPEHYNVARAFMWHPS